MLPRADFHLHVPKLYIIEYIKWEDCADPLASATEVGNVRLHRWVIWETTSTSTLYYVYSRFWHVGNTFRWFIDAMEFCVAHHTHSFYIRMRASVNGCRQMIAHILRTVWLIHFIFIRYGRHRWKRLTVIENSFNSMMIEFEWLP